MVNECNSEVVNGEVMKIRSNEKLRKCNADVMKW